MPNENVRRQSGKRPKLFAGPVQTVLGWALLLGAGAAVVLAVPVSAEQANAAPLPQAAPLQCGGPSSVNVNCSSAPARSAARGKGTANVAGGCPCEGCKECESRLNQAIKDLEARIDKDRKDAEDRIDKGVGLAEWVLGIVIALGGVVFPLIGGLAAYSQIKQAREDAKEQLERIRKNVDEFKDESRRNIEAIVQEYRSNFPQFAEMDVRMNRLLREMELRMPSEDDFNNVALFREMPEIDRQYILDCELTVAAISVFALAKSPSLRGQLSSIYGTFARFYNLRDNTLKNSGEGDFARAVSYATRMIDLNPGISEGYRMRGAVYLDRYRLLKDATPPADKAKLEELLKSAEIDLNEAIDKGTKDEVDAGAYYNRALAHYYREEYEAAVAVSKRLLAQAGKISRIQRERFLPSVYVNLGSFLAKLAILAAAAGRATDAQRLGSEAVQAVTRGVKDFETTTLEDGGLARLKKELEGELAGNQELSQLDKAFVQQLWELVREGPGNKAQPSSTYIP